MYYLETFGPRGQAIADLTWGLLALSVGVVLIISVLVLIGVFARRTRSGFDELRRLPVVRSGAAASSGSTPVSPSPPWRSPDRRRIPS